MNSSSHPQPVSAGDAEPSAEFFSVVFRGDLRALDRNPFQTKTPFGLPITVGFGHAFAEFDEFIERYDALHDALKELVWIIDRAGLINLSNGVQLGQTSWYVKASDRLEAARAALSKSTKAEGG